jgi:hypothetical protein
VHGIAGLTGQVLAASCGEPDFASQLRAGLEVVAGFVDSDRLTARSLLLEVHVAGEPCSSERIAVIERLAGALDKAGRATNHDPAPPAIAGLFLVHMAEMAAARSMASGNEQSLAESIPLIVSIATSLYLSPE